MFGFLKNLFKKETTQDVKEPAQEAPKAETKEEALDIARHEMDDSDFEWDNNFSDVQIAENEGLFYEKIQEIRRLVKEIKSYDDVLFMYEGNKIDLEMNKQELWDLLQTL